MKLPSIKSEDTRERLLAAAGAEFAKSGFQDASVRAICDAASANVSAVKYHFGSKEDLYIAVWHLATEHMVASDPMPFMTEADDPHESLRVFIAWFLGLILTNAANHPWTGNLLAHESIAPTPGALDVFIEHCADPVRREMGRIVERIVGDSVDPKTRNDLIVSVIAMCVTQKHSKPVLTKLGNPPPETPEGIARLARVIADFALLGLVGFASRDASASSPQQGKG